MKCIDCLHYEACKGTYFSAKGNDGILYEFEGEMYGDSGCEDFTDRSEWVHLPDEEYTFTVRGDIAKGVIIANCRAAEAEKALEEK